MMKVWRGWLGGAEEWGGEGRRYLVELGAEEGAVEE